MNLLVSPITKLSTLDHLELSPSLSDDLVLQMRQHPLSCIPKRIISFVLFFFVAGMVFIGNGVKFYLQWSKKVSNVDILEWSGQVFDFWKCFVCTRVLLWMDVV
jgi:hypothetical protein